MLVLNRLQELQQPDNVHFTKQGSIELAKEVKKHLLKAIPLPQTARSIFEGLIKKIVWIKIKDIIDREF